MDNRKTFLAAAFAAIAMVASAMPGERGPTPRGKPVNNLHAKISAARAEAIKFELERERAHKSPISCWSNFGTLSTVAVAQSAPATVEQKSITIVNSDVTINQ